MSPPLDIKNPITDTEKAILAALKEHFGVVPYKSGGNRIEKEVHFGTFKHNDYHQNPFQHVDTAQLPSIALSLMGVEQHSGAVVSEDKFIYSEDPNARTVIFRPQPELFDLRYNLNFLTDNSKVLNYFISRSLTVFTREIGTIAIGDQCCDLDVLVWPDASTNVANINNLSEARMEFVIRAVEFPAGKEIEYWMIRSYDVIPVGIDQTVTATVVDDEVIITIEP